MRVWASSAGILPVQMGASGKSTAASGLAVGAEGVGSCTTCK